MKQIFLLLAITTSLIFTSCEGPEGPPGEPGINILGQVFEANVDFQFDPVSSTFISPYVSFPVEVYESDVILAYRFEGTETINGEVVDIWSPLPRSLFYQDGTGDIFEYSFNHTFFDAQFVIDGNFNLSTFNDPLFLNNQIFRIAVVPAEFAKTTLSMKDLLKALKINATDIETISN